MTPASSYRLDGLEPDNLLAFLALLGLLRALEAMDATRDQNAKLCPRAAWDVCAPPLRPTLFLARDIPREALLETVANGIDAIAASYEFDGRKDLNLSRQSCRELLKREANAAAHGARQRVDLLASLMTDAAIKDDKAESVDPTPLCLLFGQGHQHFLQRLASVPRASVPPPRGKGKTVASISTMECLNEALFQP